MTETATTQTVEETMAMLDEMATANKPDHTPFVESHASDLDPEHPEWDALVGQYVSVALGTDRYFHGKLSNINAGCLIVTAKGNAVHPIVRSQVTAVTVIPKP